ncbi:Holo-[acyl-carrier-protein] synthase [Termitomyces sp. T112]|nr:Holo-[acyl-carrier-protein] synthase [Termitomyces sp. T112]KAH0587491.1 hypothetical protein H2248_006273 [Termitomyces sp. 'cryptogamus']KNZ79867.1 Holo-[acyl-carrier-protein] synthase [Termitomyces sp. J132]
MAILGIGVDILHVPRIAALFQRRGSRLPARILSHSEIFQFESLPSSDLARRIRFLAVRWAVKEAAYKAMYPNVQPNWKELSYRGLGEGPVRPKPVLEYHPLVLPNKFKIGPIHVSVSHDGEFVFASVTIESPI